MHRDEVEGSKAWDWGLGIVMIIVIVALLGYALLTSATAIAQWAGYAEARRATAECEKWNDWALVMPKWDESTQTGYFITDWQKAQCDAYGIELRGHLVDYKKQ